jgi:hypothetical protein
MVDNEGLHGMVERCASRQLSSGPHLFYLTGFQARGGVGMVAKYSGPDTGGAKVLVTAGRVSSPFYAPCAPPGKLQESSQFSICMFSSATGLDRTPRIGDAVASGKLLFVGKGSMPAVDMSRLETFREYVPKTPNANYAWAINGVLQIGLAGRYNLCITSDDG